MSMGKPAAFRPTKPDVAVFVSGVTSMGLEILAGRIIAPQFGSSIYTWGSIITVFLAALSLGYWQGGKKAATASNRRMSWLLLGTAAYVAVVIYGSDQLLLSASAIPLPARYASLPAVIMLFGPPTYLLGFISPYAAELSQKEGTGEASGHVYALGTIGSIVGAGATTYVLVPALGIDMIGLLFGFILVGTAFALTLPRLTPKPASASVAIAIVLVVAAGLGPVAFDHRGDVVYQTQTAYQELEVIDDGDVRTLYLDGARHSAMDLEDPDRHVFEYTRYFHLPMLMVDDPDEVENVLFIGGGGYTGPKDFERKYDVDIDVAELDPAVTRTAKEYFRLEESENLTAHTEDGRIFLQETDKEYDVIVLDAYQKDQVPIHLTQVEFMELAESHLDEDGVLLANVIAAPSGPGSAFYRAQYKTIDEAFASTYSFRTSSWDSVQNIEIAATKAETNFTEADVETRNDQRDLGIDLRGEVRNYMDAPNTDDVPLLTEDHAPVDNLQASTVGQEYVIEQTGEDETQPEPASITVGPELPAHARPTSGLESIPA
ncbi:spermidine synthase [Natrinema hispanicum]|uniref:Predicted spermidine synthase with an N-terminal membrane domain n=1 Tax=Natrinema hispanicum TaxID=392421 RepID=A0A1G6QH01_9EURY|nr:fused MFS/spermidine synthase [Natrinema hispanicum]SDC90925.1 Predicted spermidine synthase with an N-terminal membrane domain [Natrinema hispanicum]SET46064.1 Predicted spermidine synthase with an N-terminal membrane domain [Natrinema hispanicum]